MALSSSSNLSSKTSLDSQHRLEDLGGDRRTESRESFDEFEDEFGYDAQQRPRPSRSWFARLYRGIALSIRNRTRRPGSTGSFRGDDPSASIERQHLSQDRRKRSRGKTWGWVRKTLLVVPVVSLMFFGVVHLLLVFIGGSRLLWDLDAYDDFLPDWGKPGHIGDGLSSYPTDATRDTIPIPCHSHNDYWRRIPFYDAIHWGCTGVEADVWLFDNALFVGHSTASLTRSRTFQSLYVRPLIELLDKMNAPTEFDNNSSTTLRGVFDEDPDQTLVLLVDVKTAGPETFQHVVAETQALRDKNYLSYWDAATGFHPRAVTLVGTGNAPFDMIVANREYRDIFYDAPLDQLSDSDDGDFNTSSAYYASVSFAKAVGFPWRGGELSTAQLEIIRAQIRAAHRHGLKARYWETPSWPVSVRNHIWGVLMAEGADVLNVDDLKAAAAENWKARVHGWL